LHRWFGTSDDYFVKHHPDNQFWAEKKRNKQFAMALIQKVSVEIAQSEAPCMTCPFPLTHLLTHSLACAGTFLFHLQKYNVNGQWLNRVVQNLLNNFVSTAVSKAHKRFTHILQLRRTRLITSCLD
jgi:hypothetical protein